MSAKRTSGEGDTALIPLKQQFVRTLVGSGFAIESLDPRNTYLVARVSRSEQLGVRARYLVALSEGRFGDADVAVLVKAAEHAHAPLILVGDTPTVPAGAAALTVDQFFDRLGGPILSMLPFEPEYRSRLVTLGANALPADLVGRPDDLFEQYVHAGLQYLFRGRVIRYGQGRRFEAVPDGVVSGDGPLVLYDAKAAKDGYKTDLESVRQFADYVESYHRRWERTIGRLAGFLVVSGTFTNDEASLSERSGELFSRCGVPLAFLNAADFGAIVAMLTARPLFRPAVDWRFLFTRTSITAAAVEKQLKAREKDEVTPAGGA